MNGSEGASRPRRNPEVAFREYDGEAVVVLPSGAEINVLNPAGGLIFRLLDGTRTVAELVDTVCAEFEVPRQQAEEDVRAFLDELQGHRLLV
jgi:coenzyme PQQ synthesis protein D (PqqD)